MITPEELAFAIAIVFLNLVFGVGGFFALIWAICTFIFPAMDRLDNLKK